MSKSFFKWPKFSIFKDKNTPKPWPEEKLVKTLERQNKRPSLDLPEQVYNFQLEEFIGIWKAEASQVEGKQDI